MPRPRRVREASVHSLVLPLVNFLRFFAGRVQPYTQPLIISGQDEPKSVLCINGVKVLICVHVHGVGFPCDFDRLASVRSERGTYTTEWRA